MRISAAELLRRRRQSLCIVCGESIGQNADMNTDAPLTHRECSQLRRRPKFDTRGDRRRGDDNLERWLSDGSKISIDAKGRQDEDPNL